MTTATSRWLLRVALVVGLVTSAGLTVVLLPVMVPFAAVIAGIAVPAAGLFYLWAWRARPTA